MARKKNPVEFTKIIKTIDPLLQSIILVCLFWFFDQKGHKEHTYMKLIMYLQFISSIYNFFIRFSKKLKTERYLSFLAIVGWIVANSWIAHRIVEGKMKEISYKVIVGKGYSTISVIDSTLLVFNVAIALWYFSICIREIQHLIKKKRRHSS